MIRNWKTVLKQMFVCKGKAILDLILSYRNYNNKYLEKNCDKRGIMWITFNAQVLMLIKKF